MNRTLVALALTLMISARGLAQTPTVDQILDRYVEAIGGRAAFDKLTSRVLIGSFENRTRGLTVPLEIYAKGPDIRVELLGFGEASEGFNGVVGWSMNVTENGFRELTGPALARFKRQAVFNREVKLREQYARLAAAGTTRIGNREAFVVEAVRPDDGSEKLFFDVQTGLLVRQTVANSVIDFEDYREADGIRLPFSIRRAFPDPFGTYITKFREINHNVPIDDAKFSVPMP